MPGLLAQHWSLLLVIVFLAEWGHIPTATLQNLVESLPKSKETVAEANVGPSLY